MFEINRALQRTYRLNLESTLANMIVDEYLEPVGKELLYTSLSIAVMILNEKDDDYSFLYERVNDHLSEFKELSPIKPLILNDVFEIVKQVIYGVLRLKLDKRVYYKLTSRQLNKFDIIYDITIDLDKTYEDFKTKVEDVILNVSDYINENPSIDEINKVVSEQASLNINKNKRNKTPMESIESLIKKFDKIIGKKEV